MNDTTPSTGLNRGLQNRHIQLIALGGAIGTGLFLGSASVLKSAGPSMILGYAITGLIAVLMLRQLGEMVAEEPVSGSFSHFANRYWGAFPGFLCGWNDWVLHVLVGMAELTAVGVYVQFWWPEVPAWLTALLCFIAINGINLINVRSFGETEFWFTLVKVVAVIGMMLFGGYLLASGQGGPQASLSNLWTDGGFFPNGIEGLFMMLAVIMFSFGGLEVIGMTAAEAVTPGKTLPRAFNQVIYRILIFYIGSLLILLSLYPWSQVAAGGSPFVMIFMQIGASTTAHILNFVVLTAALSVYNCTTYADSRMLYSLACQGNAPAVFRKLDRNGVPVNATLFSALATSGCVILNYVFPGKALGMLMSLVVAATVINWMMISLIHFRFRKARAGQPSVFPAIAYPLGNVVCLVFMLTILGILLNTPDMAASVYVLPLWLLALWFGYCITGKKREAAELAKQTS